MTSIALPQSYINTRTSAAARRQREYARRLARQVERDKRESWVGGVDVAAQAARTAPSGSARSAPLVNNANITDTSDVFAPRPSKLADLQQRAIWETRIANLYRLQDASAQLHRQARYKELLAQGIELPESSDSRLGYHRVCRCSWARWSEKVTITASQQYDRTTYKGVQSCGSWSACPVCASAISEARRVELQTAVKNARDKNCVVAMATFTLPHTRRDKLSTLVDGLNEAYSRLKKTYTYKVLTKELGIDGPGRGSAHKGRLYSVRALETTYGYNGWHPHLHVLFILRPGADVARFGADLRTCWYDLLGGGWSLPDGSAGELVPLEPNRLERGVHVDSRDGEVAAYIQKYGRDPRWDISHEITKAALKKGRGGRSRHYSVNDLLWSYISTGNKRHGALWVEFGQAMFRRNQLTWSPGLREWSGLGVERSDEELAADTRDYQEDLVELNDEQWQAVTVLGKRAELLIVANSRDVDAIRAYVMELVMERIWCPVLESLPPDTPDVVHRRC